MSEFDVQLEKMKLFSSCMISENYPFKVPEELFDHYFKNCSLDQTLKMLLSDASAFSKVQDPIIELRDYTFRKMKVRNSVLSNDVSSGSTILQYIHPAVVIDFTIASALRQTFEIEEFWANAPMPDRNDSLCRIIDEFSKNVKALNDSDQLKRNFFTNERQKLNDVENERTKDEADCEYDGKASNLLQFDTSCCEYGNPMSSPPTSTLRRRFVR